MSGKIIVMEGVDSSGKATHTLKIYERLLYEGYNVKKVEFPNYKSPSSSLVKMYLNGEFGSDAGDVSPYIASTFYAGDRYASYKTSWEEQYKNGKLIISDRYVTSNMVHQASKIDDKDEKDKFLDWLYEYEYGLYGLPQPDCVIFLDMPPEFSIKLMENRANKITGKTSLDIHESDYEYLKKTYQNAKYIAEKYNWKVIECVRDGKIKTIEEIGEEIYEIAYDIVLGVF